MPKTRSEVCNTVFKMEAFAVGLVLIHDVLLLACF